MATLFVISKHFYGHVVPSVCQLFHAHVRPCLRAFSILYLSMVLGLAYLAIIFFSYRRFQKLKDEFKWLRIEEKFMNALIKDVKYVSDLGKEIDKKAHHLWDSQMRPGATVQLSDVEKEWVKAIDAVTHKAKSCRQAYQRLSRRRQFLRWVFSVLMDFRKISGLRTEIDAVIDEMYDHLRRKCNKIYGSLERSRSNVRSLQDRPLVEQNSYTYNRAVRLPPTHSIEEKLKDLIHGKPDLVRDKKDDIRYNIEFRVKLLLAFLEDLDGLRMDTKTEKAWVKLVEEAILELQQDMESILKIANRMSWIFYIGNWIAKRKLKKSHEHYDRKLWNLIAHKDMCGFKFIRRDSLKSVHRSQKKQMFSSQATAASDDGISSLLNNFHNQLSQWHAMEDFTQLHSRLKNVHKLLMDAKAIEDIEHSIMAWRDQLKEIIADAGKSLKSHGESSRSEWSENQNKTESPPKLKEIRRFNKALRILERSITIFRIKQRREENLVVGMDEDVHKVVSQLITNSENCSKHFIVGMKGIGKTTLAKMVFYHSAIQNHFESRYWVPLTDRVDEQKNVILKRLGQKLRPALTTNKEREEKEEGTNMEGKEKDYSIKELNGFLKGKKYLIVLDNILSVEAWESLKAVFRDSTNGSRILITTRHESVASNAEHYYKLRLRTKDESLTLFQQMVDLPSETSDQPDLSPEAGESQKLNSLAHKVVGRCGGLPLSILSLGYLFSGTKTVTYEKLLKVLDHIDHNQTPWTEIIDSEVDDLPLDLRKCLSYFGLFPKDSETSARRLVALWVAEGLVKPSRTEQEPPELVARKILRELISRNLVQVVERKPNGKENTCSFPSALRDLWLRSNASFDQRLAYNADEHDASSTLCHGCGKNLQNLLRSCRNPRSILFFDTREGNKPGEEIGNFLSLGIASGHLLQLQVLDLEHVFRPQLPDTIGKLIHLTYLGLRWTYLEKIPQSIGNLTNLQTLDVKHTYIRILPSSIWKLKKLRHLCMNQIYRSQIKHQPSGGSLQNLQTLRGAFVDEDSPLKDSLHRLTNLRKLELAFQLNLSQQIALAESLLELNQLKALKLKSIDEMGRPQDLKATFLSGLENLSNLYLFGKLENTSISRLPQSLTELILSASGLLDDPMPELEKLKKLECLSLYSGSYTGKSMSCSKGGFPQLHVLSFWTLQELEEWNVVEEAMPNLKKLEIRSCNSLKVPSGLGHLKTLSELKLKDMPVKFTAEIEENKEIIWGDIALSPAIIIDGHSQH